MLNKTLSGIGREKAVGYLDQYFKVGASGRPVYTGSQFEVFAGGGDDETANVIDSNDLLAVGLLAVHVPGQAVLGILEGLADELTSQLSEIPSDLKFEDLDRNTFTSLLGSTGPATRIWDKLRQNQGTRWRVGPTTASKILARKRPHLIPIYDSVVAKQSGLHGSQAQWDVWFEAFGEDRGDESSLKSHLHQIREMSGHAHLSLLRVLDIVLWMDGNGPRTTYETVGD